MREIRFRGKRIDNGEWVTGAYIHNSGKPFIISHEVIDWDDEFFAPEFWWRVDPSTVGQYTGLKDKNGREIFEGDIVEAKDPYKYNSKEIFYTCEVVFTEGAAFMLKHTYENWGTVGIRYFGLRDMELEVIGNIYDTPDLLKGTET